MWKYLESGGLSSACDSAFPDSVTPPQQVN